MLRPDIKPTNKNFSSGPCAKRPGWNIEILKKATLGRSHRAEVSKNKLLKIIKLTKELLRLPEDYILGIVPGSDTGAVEMAMWNILGPNPVTSLVWDSFGNDWSKDLSRELRLTNLNVISSDYGKLPDLSSIDFNSDLIFNWNGTTSGVCIPDTDWIPSDRKGITICDATSAAFAMEIDWTKIDVSTFSWQKCLGGEAGHGMLILSPKAVNRINTFIPLWPIPKLFQLRKENKLNQDIFNGATINTPSMLCVEDFLDCLEWSKTIGGLDALIKKSVENLEIIQDWVRSSSWIDFLSEEKNTISSTSICLRFVDKKLNNKSTEYKLKLKDFIVSILEEEEVAFDIGSYRSAPPGLRIWGGPTVESIDIKRLIPWLDWAYEEGIKNI